MQNTFQSKPLLNTVGLLCFLKIIFTFFIVKSLDFVALSLPSLFILFVITAFSNTQAWLAWTLFCILILAVMTYLVVFIMLAVNRKGAGVASIGLLVYSMLDALATLPQLVVTPIYALGFVFNLSIVILLVLLRRSRPGAPTVTNIDPSEV